MKTLTIITIGEGKGTTVPTPGSHEYADNSVVSGITALPYEGYSFVRWLLDTVEYTSNPITVVMDTDHTLYAEFSGEPPPPPPPKYNLRVTSTDGGVTEPEVGLYICVADTDAVVKATPYGDFLFDGWLLDGVRYTNNPITVRMNQDHSLHAVFVSKEVTPPQPTLELQTTIAIAGLAATCIIIASALVVHSMGVI